MMMIATRMEVMMIQVTMRARKNKKRGVNKKTRYDAHVLMIMYFYHHECIFFNFQNLHRPTYIHFLGKKGQTSKTKKGKESSDDDDSNENRSGDDSSDEETEEKDRKFSGNNAEGGSKNVILIYESFLFM